MELTLQLQAVLGHHSVLAADMMRSRLRGDPDFAQAANAALGRNTDAMVQLLGSMFGKQVGNEFRSVWAEHVASLFDYARALADHDNPAREKAVEEVDEYERDLASFFADSSHGHLNRGDANAATRLHVDHLLQQADAFEARDYPRADRIYREAYTHTFGLGKTLAVALLAPGTPTALQEPKWRLRSELGRLLGEHAVLVVAATRAGVADTNDFAAAAEAVNGNTRDVTAAVAQHDAGRGAAALAKLKAIERKLASFLGSATGNRLASATVAQALLMHDRMLVQQVDAFAAKDYQKAHDIAYSMYQHMFDLSGQLADAIGATIASRLPQGGMQTGGGGMAAVVGRR